MNYKEYFDKIKSGKYKTMIMLVIISFIFIALYYKYVVSGYIYAFSEYGDLGSDTMHTYYPVYMFFSNMIHNQDFSIYSFQLGLGQDIFSIINYILSPFDLLVVLFPPEKVHYGLIIGTYLKLLSVSYFAYRYFGLILKKDHSRLICTIIWSFSAYFIVWGQHYFFATSYLYFTAFMYYLHKFIIDTDKKHLKFIIVMVLFVINSYYFFYMSGVFSVIYIIGYALMNKLSLKSVFNKLIKLMLLAVLGVGLSAVILFPILYHFFESTRVPTSTNLLQLLIPYGMKHFITCLGRFFSTDIFGDMYFNNYTGSSNYYEAPLLFTTILSLFSMVYFCLNSRIKIYFKITFIFCYIIVLNIPLFTHFLTFNDSALRWTYLITFINIIIIGLFLEKIQELPNLRRLLATSIILYLVIVAILIFADRNKIVIVDGKILVICSLFFIIYCALLLLYRNVVFPKVLLCAIIIEIVVMNSPSVSNRGSELEKTFLSYYDDNTKEAVQAIENIDSSFYRVQKTYVSKHLNDDYVQGYHGTNIYSSTNSSHLISYFNNFGLMNKYHTINCVEFTSDLYSINTLLGVKYLVSNSEVYDPAYEEFLRTEDKIVYKNKYTLPFGYLYDHEISKEAYNSLSPIDKQAVPSKYYYRTDGRISETETISGPIITNRIDAYTLETEMVNMIDTQAGKQMKLTEGTNDAKIIFNLAEGKTDIFNYVEMNLTSSQGGSLKIQYNLDGEVKDTAETLFDFNSGQGSYLIPIRTLAGVNSIELSFTGVQNDIINSINLVSYNYEVLFKNLTELRSKGIEQMNYDKGNFTGIISNSSNKARMLCIPIIFSDNWHVLIDNNEVEKVNINGGLIGVNINSGEHEIQIYYHSSSLCEGVFISLASLVITIMYLFINENRLKKMKKFLKR